MKKKYTYNYPRPAVTADVVLVTTEHPSRVLLVKRKNEPFAGKRMQPIGRMRKVSIHRGGMADQAESRCFKPARPAIQQDFDAKAKFRLHHRAASTKES